MTKRQFNTLMGVGIVCVTAIIAIAICVVHITSAVLPAADDYCDD